ncbi:hypothetical protein KAS08_00600 [Candidatus Pacearchaeota archaeon]|nr:hypothetical protein [Candidatus Pacearchaeota archaeon]
MLKSKKHVFWEAAVITVVIFLAGLLFGMLVETSNSSKVSQLYIKSEISLTDAMATATLTEGFDFDCKIIKKSNIDFANRVYEEAITLEEYEDAGLLTENLMFLHKKYDLLRTLIWTSNQNSFDRCDNYDLLIYLYEVETEDTVKQATQNVWSKILYDVKINHKDDILLLPIAADQNLTSLDLLISQYDVKEFPALIINNDNVLYEIDSVSGVESLLN